MLDLQQLYADAHSGAPLDVDGLVAHLTGFERVYVWGAGHLGSEIGRKLLELGVRFSYWDTRASTVGSLHGVPVLRPFHSDAAAEATAVVFCITSSFVRDHCLRDAREHGFHHVVMGDCLFEGLACTFDDHIGFKACRDARACDVYTCLKNETFHRRQLGVDRMPPGESLYFKNITFVIGQRCTLRCKYCYAYTNAYPENRRVQFPTERILADIDATFDAIDGVKIVPLIGGETFLHPDLHVIVRRFLEKSNFGVLNVTTNGICRIRDEHLAVLDHPRIQVVFSNYKTALTEAQCEVFDRNVERVRASGAQTIVLNETPQWNVPTTLWDRGYSPEVMRAKRATCRSPLICKYVKNGRFFPCSIADSIHSIGVADYPGDHVALDPALSRAELRASLHRLLDRDAFDSCRHCEGVGGNCGVTAVAGEQGYYEVVQRPG